MLNLPTTAAQLQVVTGTPTSVAFHTSWIDLGPPPANLVQPGWQNGKISLATTTTIVTSPAATFDRNMKYVAITNLDVVACVVTVQTFDGAATFPIFGPVSLQPGYSLQYNTDGDGWRVYNAAGRILVAAEIQGIVAISAGTQFATSGTVSFANSNGISFGMVGSSVVTASYVPGAVSAGTTLASLGTVVFSNFNNVSFGLNGYTVTASVNVAAGSINLSAGTTSNLSSAFTFANSNNVSFGLNAGTITASVAPAFTVSCFSQDADFVTNFAIGQASLSIQKLSVPAVLVATQLALVADFLGTYVSSDAVTISHAIYTMSGATASLASSASRGISWTSGSATTATSLYGGASGTRYRTVSVNYSMTPGDYLFAWCISTANGVSVNVFGRAAMNIVGTYDGVETSAPLNGVSVSSVNAFPVSIGLTNTGYMRTGFSAMRQPGNILFGSGL